MIDVVDETSINIISNITIIVKMTFRNNCKLIHRRNVNVNLIFNDEKFILFHLCKQVYKMRS